VFIPYPVHPVCEGEKLLCDIAARDAELNSGNGYRIADLGLQMVAWVMFHAPWAMPAKRAVGRGANCNRFSVYS
jgi:hypothetical protein